MCIATVLSYAYYMSDNIFNKLVRQEILSDKAWMDTKHLASPVTLPG